MPLNYRVVWFVSTTEIVSSHTNVVRSTLLPSDLMKRLIAVLLLTTFSLLLISSSVASDLVLQKGDHICLVGNELGERMQHRNH